MNLDELIADAHRRKGLKSPKRSKRVDTKSDYHRTKEELRALALERCIPVSIHLRMIRQTCTCGEVYQSVNTTPLIKRVSPSLTHFEAHEDITPFDMLPRYLEIAETELPYCQACFNPEETTVIPVPIKEEPKPKGNALDVFLNKVPPNADEIGLPNPVARPESPSESPDVEAQA
jgi:hypothetical protein